MRTDKELLKIVINNIDKYFKDGLCRTFCNIAAFKIISWKEAGRLEYLIVKEFGKSYCYIWPKGNKRLRIEWLEQQIKKLDHA